MGMVVNAVGGFVKNIGDIQANEAKMRIAEQNKRIGLGLAAGALMKGDARASAKLAEGTYRKGAVTAAAAAGDVDVAASGSVQKALDDTATVNARDVLAIKYGAENDVFGYLMKARDEEIKVETAKRQSILIPFENLLGVGSSNVRNMDFSFSVGGGSGAGREGLPSGMGDYGNYEMDDGSVISGYGAGD